MMPSKIPLEKLIGRKFGKLILLNEVEPDICIGGDKKRRFSCQCECGNFVEARMSDIKNGRTQSCGCLRDYKISNVTRTHDKRYHPLYSRWIDIKKRCLNKNCANFNDYGGRGIKICDEWFNDFQAFYDWAIANGFKKELQIDRENNDGDYCPANCRFIPQIENERNKRTIKLSLEEAQDIRNAYNLGCFSVLEINKAYGISDATTRRVLNNKAWV